MQAGDEKRVGRSSDFTGAALGSRCPRITQGPDHYAKALHVTNNEEKPRENLYPACSHPLGKSKEEEQQGSSVCPSSYLSIWVYECEFEHTCTRRTFQLFRTMPRPLIIPAYSRLAD